jgi:stage II sporulation protein D
VLLLAAGAAAAQPAEDSPGVVRVRIFAASSLPSVELRAHEGPVLLRADGRLAATLQPGHRATIRASGGRVAVVGPGVDVLASSVEAVAQTGAFVGIERGATRRRYAGSVRATSSGALQLINVVPTEEYVAAVVAGEYPFPEIEGIKAQAVLARTYALHRRGRLGDHDVVDSIMDQVYPGADAATALTREAAAETRGEVLAYDGGIAEVYYSSSNGGHTAFNDAVWGRAPLPYLRGRPDPYDASPDSRWTARIAARRVHEALGRRYGGRVTGVRIDSRSADGRVHWMRLEGARRDRILGQDFRMMTIEVFGGRVLRSTLFDMRREGSEYVFEGRGWGHGVGLSQYGARAQAQQGRSYREILDFYFAGAALTTAEDAWRAVGGAGPAAPTTPTDPAERAEMGLRSRPLTRRERAAAGASVADRIEERLRDAEGRILPTEPDSSETEERRHTW